MKNSEEWNHIVLPIPKNIHLGSLRDGIKGITAEEARDQMKEMFNKFEKETGFKPVVIGSEMPINAINPKENCI